MIHSSLKHITPLSANNMMDQIVIPDSGAPLITRMAFFITGIVYRQRIQEFVSSIIFIFVCICHIPLLCFRNHLTIRLFLFFFQYNVYKAKKQHFSIYWHQIYIAQFDSVAHNESNMNEQESIRCEILQEVYHV